MNFPNQAFLKLERLGIHSLSAGISSLLHVCGCELGELPDQARGGAGQVGQNKPKVDIYTQLSGWLFLSLYSWF